MGFILWGLIISISYPLTSDKVLKIDNIDSFSLKIFLENINFQVWLFYGVISFVCIFIAGLIFTELSRTPELILGEEENDLKEKKVITNKEIEVIKSSLKIISNILDK